MLELTIFFQILVLFDTYNACEYDRHIASKTSREFADFILKLFIIRVIFYLEALLIFYFKTRFNAFGSFFLV